MRMGFGKGISNTEPRFKIITALKGGMTMRDKMLTFDLGSEEVQVPGSFLAIEVYLNNRVDITAAAQVQAPQTYRP